MSSSNTPTKGAAPINVKDAEFMFRVVQNMEGKPAVNWDKVATALNYKSASVASTRFSQIKKKMDASLDGPGASGFGTESTTPTKAPKGKANKVTKAPAKTRTPRKGVAQPVKKGVKSTAVVTKDEDSEMDDDKEDDGDDEEAPAAKQEEDDDSFDIVDRVDEQ